MNEYAELQVTTNFSFLRGASHPEEYIATAASLGYQAIAITDHNSLAGVVRAHVAAKQHAIRVLTACRLHLQDGPPLLAYPVSKEGYCRLSALLSTGNLRAEKGHCLLYREDVYAHAQDLLFVALPPDLLTPAHDLPADYIAHIRQYKEALGQQLYLGATCRYEAQDAKMLYRLHEYACRDNIPMVATNDVYYHEPSRRELQDILTCIREKCTIQNAGFRLYANAERHMKPIDEMYRLFRHYPDALKHTLEIAEACQFSLTSLKYEYPKEITSEGRTPQEELTLLAWEGARNRYKEGIPEKIHMQLQDELTFIEKKQYAAYFLTVYDFVRFARERNILCQGRGSAANSVVCFCLGITSVDPSKFRLLFARFMSDARDEPPDIDVDFEHERREEVMQYIFSKYGRDRAGVVATVTTLHYRGAVRDVGKAMGLSQDVVGRLASTPWELGDEWRSGHQMSQHGFDANDQHLLKVLELTSQLIGFPRQLGQHTGGFVITEGKLTELCPVMHATMEGRTCIEWNKDDIEALGFLKVDVLALGMLTCIRKGLNLLEQHYGINKDMAEILQTDDPKVYDMICRADTIGVFQIESRAQMSMLPRLQPRKFYDLVIEVAIVRPGPIQGDMVHPYLKRRDGKEQVTFPSKALEDLLSRTLGVPLFQEQAMEIAIVAAGFTPAEADALRRSMATFKAKGLVSQHEAKLVAGMIANGYEEAYAKRVFRQLEGFGSYGFPESHAASFALLVYVSAYLKCHYPEVFAAALLNSMPMGFYQPAQIVIDARKHGVIVRPVDVNDSYWDNTLEEQDGAFYALRLGFRQVKGLAEPDMETLIAKRQNRYTSINALADAGVSVAAIERLADADAFQSMGLDRRRALWEATAIADKFYGLYEGQMPEAVVEESISLPALSSGEAVMQDYKTLSLSLKAHPVSLIRKKLSELKVTAAADLIHISTQAKLRVAGLVLVRQRPGTAKGVWFITLEDETGTVNLVIYKKLAERFRKEILQSSLLMVDGTVQREGAVIHVIVQRCYNMSSLFHELLQHQQDAASLLTLSRADEQDMSGAIKDQRVLEHQKAIQGKLFPEGRNFR